MQDSGRRSYRRKTLIAPIISSSRARPSHHGVLQRVLALFALLAGFAGSAAHAQTVRGIVTRAGAPIPGVVVQLLDSTD
ncbi:MAG: hypothetical protein ACK5ZO_17960, partial [Gemmatimonas sp.]